MISIGLFGVRMIEGGWWWSWEEGLSWFWFEFIGGGCLNMGWIVVLNEWLKGDGIWDVYEWNVEEVIGGRDDWNLMRMRGLFEEEI